MHKVTKHVMPPEEARATTPCKADPERWFPDEQKPDPYAVAACWSCHFQRGCARRALAQPLPEFGIWGGYRLAPGPGLNRTRAQLAIVAGLAMGPPASPGKEVAAALEDLAAKPTDPVPAAGERTPARRAAARNPLLRQPCAATLLAPAANAG
ncbi:MULTISPECIES: WhiB family transcriptional regulator [Mycobacterium]|uniref:WhiB family transcriptional regulator n=1 Tax=Mycobacterium bouchedurhonense TaxID=701041 RepID=A0AAW5SBR0_MYCBC|nr:MULTISPECIES: WhiB family transcriptional regulator [Mycobacterium]MCV6992963.1 WhiB family transcriptional regulator [Mycobacterium bouchedurhonense]MCV6993172.1 WhiB family transcriptional regulator [Mycobacterium timonense]MDA3641959.1 WhiB family transcriptional regulator [Mycobacterium xenopi]MDA3659846.1 WhiB family transcriptional regulator [Mycobacterium xenopi]MDA3664391.1 WhiB family transcriptional regulator [Mycobacterium xenopi]